MSIAAGFKVSGGVLLCADTMHQSATSKSHQTKIVRYNIDDACVLTFALAGNESFSKMAIQDCRDAVSECKQRSLKSVRSVLRSTIKRINEEYVDTRPSYEIEFSRFDLLICVWLASERKARLFATSGPVLLEVEDYELRGTGSDIGRYTVSLCGFSRGMHMARVARIAHQAIAAAKSYDPSCGGSTTIEGVRNSDGRAWGPGFVAFPLVEDFMQGYWYSSGRLLTDLTNPEMGDSECNQSLTDFASDIKALRIQWKKRRATVRLTNVLIAIGDDPADSPPPGGTKRDR